jgi:hypothetical protein
MKMLKTMFVAVVAAIAVVGVPQVSGRRLAKHDFKTTKNDVSDSTGQDDESEVAGSSSEIDHQADDVEIGGTGLRINFPESMHASTEGDDIFTDCQDCSWPTNGEGRLFLTIYIFLAFALVGQLVDSLIREAWGNL